MTLSSSALDRIEKYTLCLIFSFFAVRMANAYAASGHVINLLYIFDQSIVVVFILLRREASAITRRVWDWVASWVATFLPLAMTPVTAENAILPAQLTIIVMLVGLMFHLYAKLILRRSFGVVPANRGVKVSGPYKFVRHPMYAGYMLVHLALLLAGWNAGNLVIVAIVWCLFIVRIIAEERVLSADHNYGELKRVTPYRLLPGVF